MQTLNDMNTKASAKPQRKVTKIILHKSKRKDKHDLLYLFFYLLKKIANGVYCRINIQNKKTMNYYSFKYGKGKMRKKDKKA